MANPMMERFLEGLAILAAFVLFCFLLGLGIFVYFYFNPIHFGG